MNPKKNTDIYLSKDDSTELSYGPIAKTKVKFKKIKYDTKDDIKINWLSEKYSFALFNVCKYTYKINKKIKEEENIEFELRFIKPKKLFRSPWITIFLKKNAFKIFKAVDGNRLNFSDSNSRSVGDLVTSA